MRRPGVIAALSSQTQRVALAVGASLFVALAMPMAGEADEVMTVSPNKLKAAYIFNFAKFVEWPRSGPTDDLVLCFIGASGVYDLLAHDVAGSLLGKRRVVVRSVDDAEASDDCGLLYVDASVNSLARVVSHAASHALTVSDQHDFIHHGGSIEFFNDGNRLRFNINLGNAHVAGLRISSQLLQLASKVEQD